MKPYPHAAPVFFRCAVPVDSETAGILRHLQECGLLCADHRLRRRDRDILALEEGEIRLLRESGVTVEVISKYSNRPPSSRPAPDHPAATADALATGFVSSYLDTAGIVARFETLHASFPATTQLFDLPEASTGYDGAAPGIAGPAMMKVFRITTTPASYSKPGLLIVAGLHAREWVPPLAVIEFAEQLLQNYAPGSSDPDVATINQLVEGLDILMVPAGNPDGINYSRHDDAMWRKNRRPNPPALSCPGVDINRNFSIYWGQAGSSASPCDYQIYHGPSAFSEVESRNIRYILEQFPNILAAADCHSYGENFLRPQPTGGTYIASEPVPAADNAIYLALEAAMNAAVASISQGKSYGTGTTSNHAGTFDEYTYFGHRIFGFEIETAQDFQPPIADALVSVQETAAALRALAKETLNLGSRFITPASIVSVLDKSGSMIASGYVDATRSNAQRLVDLMSLNESAGVISFNQKASCDLPLTTLAAPGAYAGARAAVAGIIFGGTTSIGAGLQAAVSALAGATGTRSILLLSDGYENTPPMVASVLPSLPAGVPVHTIALGLASDQALLQNIAAQTGGSYFFSPDEMGLFQIYNVARAALMDDSLVLEEEIPLAPDDNSRFLTRQITIDEDADYAVFCAALPGSTACPSLSLRMLTSPSAGLSRLRRRTGNGYQVLELKRPSPGTYELQVDLGDGVSASRCSLAAYVRSPIRFWLDTTALKASLGRPLYLPLALLEHGEPLENWSLRAQVFSPATSLRILAEQWKKRPAKVPPHYERLADIVPPHVLQALSERNRIRAETGRDP